MHVTNTPIFRPLISMDKLEIIKIAQEIDTYEISNLPYEDCCTIFTPAAPKTKPKKEKVEFYESFVDFEPLFTEAMKIRKQLFRWTKGYMSTDEISTILF